MRPELAEQTANWINDTEAQVFFAQACAELEMVDRTARVAIVGLYRLETRGPRYLSVNRWAL